jgi:hypothetical protein
MKGTNAIWKILDNREFDERMSRRLWREINQEVEFEFSN